MDTGKLIGLIILMIITTPLAGFIWVPLLFFGWKYVKFAIKIDLIVIYLFMRIPIWFFIQLPLYTLKVGSGKISAFFTAGFNKLRNSWKSSGVLMFFVGAIFVFLFAPSASSGSITSLSWWYSSMEQGFMIIVGTVSVTFFLLSLKEALSGNVAQGAMPWSSEIGMHTYGEVKEHSAAAGRRNERGAERAKEGARNVADKAAQAKGIYDDIDVNAGQRAAKMKKFLLSSDMRALFTDLAKDFGIIGENGVLLGASSWIFLLTFVIAFVFFLVQLGLIILFLWGYVQIIAPMVLGPLGAALGLGSEYGNWIGGEVGDRYLAGLDARVDLSDEVATVMEARQRVFCLLEGPACFRQWQMNNTRTPNSENVGETYKLNLDRFEVGSGEQVDIAYKNGDYKLPISFGLSNSRNGMYGINALNVSYRLKVLDFSRTNVIGEDDPYCETDWKPVQGYDIRDKGEDAKYAGNDLYPGTSASTGFMRLEEITLKKCGLLQPGAGETKTVLLEVKYDYFSEATLYFDAMARQVMQENPDITTEWKPSETADTPVKSVLNVNSPVLYDMEATLDEAAIPFDMRASLTAGNSDAEYRINNLEVIQSSQVQISDDSSCQLGPVEEGSRILEPSGEAAEIIADRERSVEDETMDLLEGGEDENEKEERWFSSDNPPPFFGCSMELSDPGQINPEGQTLSMDVRSNYTVKLDEQLERFRVINTQCSSRNCPFLVTKQFAEQQDKPRNWKIQCRGPDSSDGCSVVKGDPDEWSDIQYMTKDGRSHKLDSKLESGEYAYDPFEAGVVYDEEALKDNMTDYDDEIGAAIGLKESEITQIENGAMAREGFAVLSVPEVKGGVRGTSIERDVKFVTLEEKICSNKNKDMLKLEKFKKETEQPEPFSAYNAEGKEAYLISFYPQYTKCEEETDDSTDVPDVRAP